ncbi:MAG TPA: M24 family metallopeptidase [Candidatus Lustribacter sp.]|jgi:Xaa-Pro aminopeptidase|nr:M24 family metallopeptidase [Candidatus Lustribacter sp.]
MTASSTDLQGSPDEKWDPGWSNAVFSLAERDRRWAKVRSLMARDGIDLIVCMPCTNSHDRGAADARYLTQLGENSDESSVAFPLDGEVRAWHSRPGVWPSANWFTDIRSAGRGTGGATLVGYINEHPQYKKATIAIGGLTSTPMTHCRAAEGEINWQSVEILKAAFPGARFVSASTVLGEARWIKSEEEIDFLRKGTKIAEITLDAIRETMRAGVPEREVFAAMMYANAKAGGSFTPMFGWITGPQGHLYHRLEQPSFRTFAAGDMLGVEIEGRWGGYIAQIDQSVIIGAPADGLNDAMKLAYEAFDKTCELLKPGVTMGELADTAVLTALGGRIRAGLGFHGRGTGDDGPLLVAGVPLKPEIRNLAIVEGCCFAVKPSVSLDGGGEFCRWGDSVVVGKNGGIRLGTRPQELIVLK